jgi:hypothetical protein
LGFNTCDQQEDIDRIDFLFKKKLFCSGFDNCYKLQDIDRIDFLFKKLEPIPQFINVFGLSIREFKIRGLLLERIYRELRGPPVQVSLAILGGYVPEKSQTANNKTGILATN